MAVKVKVRMVVTVKRAGLPIEDEAPWEQLRSDSFSTMDDTLLPGNQSFGVLEDGDETWPELEEWVETHPDEPADIEYLSGGAVRSGMFHRVTQRMR